MSLNYDTTKCKGLTKDDRKDYTWPICSMMLITGIDQLDGEKKSKEFRHRLKLLEAVNGLYHAIEKEGKQESAFTDELLGRFEGIKTNVSFESFGKFAKRLLSRKENS